MTGRDDPIRPRLDDEQIERYSRQLILAEVGPDGQQRLGAARVAVVGTDGAAEPVVAYLAAAGVGWLAADEALHGATDSAQPDLRLVTLRAAEHEPLDVVVVTGATVEAVAQLLPAWPAAVQYWIAAGRAGASPPCPLCAVGTRATSPDDDTHVPPELAALRGTLLGTVVATEVAKALLAIGIPLAGRLLVYDPLTATITTRDVGTARPGCQCRQSPT